MQANANFDERDFMWRVDAVRRPPKAFDIGLISMADFERFEAEINAARRSGTLASNRHRGLRCLLGLAVNGYARLPAPSYA